MPEELSRQSIIDEEHLKLLAIGYMISAAMSAVFSLFGLMYAAMGVVITQAIKRAPELSANANNAPPPEFIAWLLGGVGLAIFLALIVMAGLKLAAAFCIKKRKSRVFCMVVAAIECLEIPYGTLIGVCTFIVLDRDSVIRLFDANAAKAPAGA